jgi:ribosome-interacting GTPase 1
MPNALQPARAALLVVDLSIAGCVENVAAIKEQLEEKRIHLVPHWPNSMNPEQLDVTGAAAAPSNGCDGEESAEDIDDTFRVLIPTLLVAAKSDLDWERDEINVLEELIGVEYPAVSVSTRTGEGLDRLGRLLFDGLGIIRIYTKIPGRPPDTDRPFTVFRGETVYDVARLVHREMAASLRYARVWGSAKFEGQQVGKDYVVSDGDVLELHA